MLIDYHDLEKLERTTILYATVVALYKEVAITRCTQCDLRERRTQLLPFEISSLVFFLLLLIATLEKVRFNNHCRIRDAFLMGVIGTALTLKSIKLMNAWDS